MLNILRLSLQYDRGKDADAERDWLDKNTSSWVCDHCGEEFKMYLRPSIIRYSEEVQVWLCRPCLKFLAGNVRDKVERGESEENARKSVMNPIISRKK